MFSFLLTSLIHYNENSPISKKIKALYHFWGEIIILEIKFYKGAKRLVGERRSGRNDAGANGKVGETTRGLNDSGRMGKWAKRLRGERESGRNDPDSKYLQFYIISENLLLLIWYTKLVKGGCWTLLITLRILLQDEIGLVYFRVSARLKCHFLMFSSIPEFRPEGQIWDPVRRDTKTIEYRYQRYYNKFGIL